MTMDLVGKVVVRFSGCDQNDIQGIGYSFGYMENPTYLIDESGGTIYWSESLTREATEQEQIDYWKARALALEANLNVV